MEENKIKECYSCRNFKRYYVKGLSRFNKTNLGYCGIRQEIIEKHNICDKYQYSNHAMFSRKKTSLRILADLLTDITAIKQILQEEEEEKNKV